MIRVGLWTLVAAVGIGFGDEETARVIAWGAVTIIVLGAAYGLIRSFDKSEK